MKASPTSEPRAFAVQLLESACDTHARHFCEQRASLEIFKGVNVRYMDMVWPCEACDVRARGSHGGMATRRDSMIVCLTVYRGTRVNSTARNDSPQWA